MVFFLLSVENLLYQPIYPNNSGIPEKNGINNSDGSIVYAICLSFLAALTNVSICKVYSRSRIAMS